MFGEKTGDGGFFLTEFFGAGLSCNLFGEFNVLGVADRDGLDADHLGNGSRDAGVHVCGGIGEDFVGEVDVVVGEVPDVASVDSWKIDV